MFRRINFFVAVVLLLVAAACGHAPGKRLLTVSIEPQRYLLERIAGDVWTVNTMLPNGADPENFDPPMSALKSAMNSKAYFRVGTMAFEDALTRRLGDGLRMVDTSEGIELIHGTHDCGGHHGHSDEADPHIWSSVRNAKVMARNMYEAMVKIDSDNEATYTANYDRLKASLDSLDAELAQALSSERGATFLTWHPSLSYFARDYSLNQLALGAEGKELSAEAFRSRIDKARETNAVVMILQPDMDNGRSEEVARQAGARTVTVNLLGYDWPRQMRLVAESIKKL